MNVPPEVEAEFDEELDQYAADYEESLRRHLAVIDQAAEDSEPNEAVEKVPATEATDATESLAERSSALLTQAIDSIFGEGGVYP